MDFVMYPNACYIQFSLVSYNFHLPFGLWVRYVKIVKYNGEI